MNSQQCWKAKLEGAYSFRVQSGKKQCEMVNRPSEMGNLYSEASSLTQKVAKFQKAFVGITSSNTSNLIDYSDSGRSENLGVHVVTKGLFKEQVNSLYTLLGSGSECPKDQVLLLTMVLYLKK